MDDRRVIPRKIPEVLYRIIDGKAVIVGLQEVSNKKDKVIVFNETATKIWELIDGKRSIAVISNCILKEYGVDRNDIGSKVDKFILKLKKNSLIKVHAKD